MSRVKRHKKISRELPALFFTGKFDALDRFREHEVPSDVPQALFLLGAMPFGF
jgi:hypothetical protein